MGLKIMKKSKILSVLLLAVISFILISADFPGNKNLEIQLRSNDYLNIINSPNVAEDHATILIDGNAELATFISNEGLSGDGTNVSPYIIENFNIIATIDNWIEIINTDAYLIIQNCTVEGDFTKAGIF